MPIRVIIAISIRSLGEIIQQTLQETGLYQAELVDGGAQFFSRIQVAKFSVAILDYRDIKDPAIFTRTLLDALPTMKIIAFPPQETAEQNALLDIGVSNWLSVPFYMPNLLGILQNMTFDSNDRDLHTLTENSSTVIEQMTKEPKLDPVIPEWLGDVNRVAQHLTHLFLESSAQAALITHQHQIWAYAGQLQQPAAEELSHAVSQYSAGGGGDLTRFIHLNTTNSDYMLYATSLGGDFVLALVFDTDVSFMEMRNHVENLAKELSDPSQDWLDSVGVVPDVRDQINPQRQPDAVPKDLDYFESLYDEIPAIPMDWRPDQDVSEDRQAFLDRLLTAPNVPEIDGHPIGQPSITTAAINNSDGETDVVVSSVPKVDNTFKNHASTFAEKQAEPFLTAYAAPIKESYQLIDAQNAQSELLNIDDLEPETASMVNITYTSVLIPRLPQHHLVGELAEVLPRWVTELSLAFGWRLEHLSVRPSYLHWRAVVPAHYPPARMVLDMAAQTSRRIYAEFSSFDNANPSEEFWADGHLIVSGRDKLSQQLVQDFIIATRSRQGMRS
ncbi:MAG: transposase [Chloroflexota bacterium]